MLSLFALAAIAGTGSESSIQITLDPLCSGRIDRMQCGQFVEYLCNLVPGMWSEKLYDGDFVGLSPYKFDFIKETDFKEKPWYPSGAANRAEYSIDQTGPFASVSSQRISIEPGAKATAGISQDGLYLDPKEPCTFGIWMRMEGTPGKVRVRFHDGPKTLAQSAFEPKSAWAKFTAHINPTARSTNATVAIEFDGPGTLWLRSASLMPENSVGGWRPDVVQALRDLKPGVIRIGGSVMDDPNLGSFEWSDTVGDPDRRKPFRAWGGLQPTGAGLEEFVQLCRAVDAEPLICVRVREKKPADATAEVEYFNGAATTPMGALRAKNGHPAPYNVRFWQVGNERSGADYEKDLPAFCRAMKSADPSIRLFSSFPTEGVIKGAGEYVDYVCPHHYDCEDLAGENEDFTNIRRMIAQLAPGRAIKVAVTEWNTTAGDRGLKRARLWTLENALACSRYQNLMHRNCDLVEIANRSNLTNSFCSGILQTDRYRLYMTPTYYAQMLYSNYAGDRPLRIDPPAPLKAGLDISATLSDSGEVLTLFAVNDSPDQVTKSLQLPPGFGGDIEAWTLADTHSAGEPDVTNTFDDPARVSPVRSHLKVGAKFDHTFPPLSLTVLRIRR